MKTFDTQKLFDALEARRKAIKAPGKTGLSSPQIDEACSLFVAAERFQLCSKRQVTERDVKDIIEDYIRKAKGGDRSAEAVVETVTKSMKEHEA